jgi:hypothetical protein
MRRSAARQNNSQNNSFESTPLCAPRRFLRA